MRPRSSPRKYGFFLAQRSAVTVNYQKMATRDSAFLHARECSGRVPALPGAGVLPANSAKRFLGDSGGRRSVGAGAAARLGEIDSGGQRCASWFPPAPFRAPTGSAPSKNVTPNGGTN